MPHNVGILFTLLISSVLALPAQPATAQSFDLDVGYTEGMRRIGMELLLDAPVGTPVYVSNFSLCVSDGALNAVGNARLEADDLGYGLLRVSRLEDGSVAVEIPEIEDLYPDDEYTSLFEDAESNLSAEEDFEYEDERFLALWTILQSIPCTDWGDLTSDPSTLLPVASIDGATSMSELLASQPLGEKR